MLQGLPASGKSTRAEKIVAQGNWVRLNRDLIREMLHFDKWSGINEGITVDTEKSLARYFLQHTKMSVVIDDCNLNPKNKDMWSTVAKDCNASFEVEKIKTDCYECVMRDEQREKRVGRHTIINMALQYDIIPNIKNSSLILCDLDGTLCDISHKLHYVKNLPEGQKKDWKSFFANIYKDKLRKDVCEQLLNRASLGHPVVFMSARPDTYRYETFGWLSFMFPYPYLTLIMRKGGDTRPDVEVKKDMYERYFKGKYEIDTIFDDRPIVIRMWRELGLNVTDVGNGVEF